MRSGVGGGGLVNGAEDDDDDELVVGAKTLVMLVGLAEVRWVGWGGVGSGCGWGEPGHVVSICLSTWAAFMRFQHIGQATRPSSGSSSGSCTGSGSGM